MTHCHLHSLCAVCLCYKQSIEYVLHYVLHSTVYNCYSVRLLSTMVIDDGYWFIYYPLFISGFISFVFNKNYQARLLFYYFINKITC